MNFFGAIIGFIEAIASLISNLVLGILNLVTLIPQGITYLTYVIGFAPPAVNLFLVAGISISIVFLVLGR